MTIEGAKLRGLQSVRVSKKYLLEKLYKNRTEHEKSYYEILDARQKKIIADLSGLRSKFNKELKRRLDEIGADREATPGGISLPIYAPKPENHTKDYDKAISLLEASLDEEFELSYSEFNQYVNDDWAWKETFMTCSGSYISPAKLGEYTIVS